MKKFAICSALVPDAVLCRTRAEPGCAPINTLFSGTSINLLTIGGSIIAIAPPYGLVAARARKKVKLQLPTAIAARNARNAMFTKLNSGPRNSLITASKTNHRSSDKSKRKKLATTTFNDHSNRLTAIIKILSVLDVRLIGGMQSDNMRTRCITKRDDIFVNLQVNPAHFLERSNDEQCQVIETLILRLKTLHTRLQKIVLSGEGFAHTLLNDSLRFRNGGAYHHIAAKHGEKQENEIGNYQNFCKRHLGYSS